MHIVSLNIDSGNEAHPSKRAQIAYLEANKAFSKMPSKYADFVNIFLSELARELLKYIEINNYVIEFIDD